MAEHPNWMVEGCASGGRRIDIGTMKRAHTYWFSDQTSKPFLCRYMQARANRFLPGHLLNSSVSVRQKNGDTGFDDAAVLSRMLGKLAFDGDIASWSGPLVEKMATWVRVFKDIRHLLVENFYQLFPIPTSAVDGDALQFASYTGHEAIVFVFAGCEGGTYRLILRGLRAEMVYRVFRAPAEAVAIHDGANLMAGSLTVEMSQNEAGLWRITALNEANLSGSQQ
jgi:alpha-galactosidase